MKNSTNHWTWIPTLLFFSGIFVLALIVQQLVYNLISPVPLIPGVTITSLDFKSLLYSLIISNLVGILLIWGTIKLNDKVNFRSYLNLDSFTFKEFSFWAVIAISFVFLQSVITDFFSIDNDFLNQIVKSESPVLLVLISFGVIAPIYEEMIFRGFLFKGIEHSKIGGTGAIIVSSLLFTIVHFQYNLILLLFVLAIASILGYCRFKSKNTSLCIIIHIINNSTALALALS